MKGKDSYIITYLYSLSLIHVHILVFFSCQLEINLLLKLFQKQNLIFFLFTWSFFVHRWPTIRITAQIVVIYVILCRIIIPLCASQSKIYHFDQYADSGNWLGKEGRVNIIFMFAMQGRPVHFVNDMNLSSLNNPGGRGSVPSPQSPLPL